ncbi:hypothetical protein [Flavobacterium sp.]|uniref:hypothetical protein n=1 Tax=Flavobacterium sp. TaxID=239 RepID=UPI00261A76A3|nr:hypothetical protein [Flavobacterium sp.]
MSIHFYNINDKNNPIFCISDDDISDYIALFDLFNSKYNDLFDFYGDFYLYKNHIEFLIQEITKNKLLNKKQSEFLSFLEFSKSTNINIYVIGD